MATETGRPDVFEYDESEFILQTAPWVDTSPVQNSRFDETLRSRWDAAMQNGAFRYNIDHVVTRILPGRNRYVGQLNVLRGTSRRQPHKIVDLNQPFDPSKFNFTDVKLSEVVFDMRNKSRNRKTSAVSEMDRLCSLDHTNCTMTNDKSQENCFTNQMTKNDEAVRSNAQDLSETIASQVSNGEQDELGSTIENTSYQEKGKKVSAKGNEIREDDDYASLVINVSPMEYGHCLLVPQRLSCLSQILTKQALTIAVEAMLLSNHRSLLMGYNSLCAFASVNHLHFHFFYLEYELIANACPMQHLGGCFYEYTALPCPGFGLQLHGSTVEEMTSLAINVCNYLHNNDVAHNLFLCRGTVFNEPPDSYLTTLRLFIWPRKKFVGNKSSEEFNVACIELAGYLPIRLEAGFYNLTESEVDEIIADACLPPSEYETIRNYVIELGLENAT